MAGVLAELRAACPTDPGTARDRVDGLEPTYVAAPGTLDEAAGVMRAAAHHRLRVLPRGAGTKLDRGAPAHGCDLIVDTGRLDRLLEHASGDLICRVQAGMGVRQLQAELAPYGQQLALDDSSPATTAGGALATADSGPRRLRYGTPRDLLIGITVVLADGTIARSGGKVVKNVAGYDLGKLYTGSYGTLGLIVEATFRLHPLPQARGFVTWTAPDVNSAHERMQAVAASQLTPTAVEVDRPRQGGPISVGVELDGGSAGIDERLTVAAGLLGPGTEVSEAAPSWWGPLENGIMIKVTLERAGLAAVLLAVDDAADHTGLVASVRGSAAGVLYAGLPADAEPAAVAAFLDQMRRLISAHGGSATVHAAPVQIRAVADPWGPTAGMTLMRRIKDRFDPEHRLSPGRFVGGI